MISVREISVYIYVNVMSFFSFFLYSFQKYIFIFSFLVFFLFSSTIFYIFLSILFSSFFYLYTHLFAMYIYFLLNCMNHLFEVFVLHMKLFVFLCNMDVYM